MSKYWNMFLDLITPKYELPGETFDAYFKRNKLIKKDLTNDKA